MAKNNSASLLRQIWDFLKVRKAWWLLPLIIMTLLFGVLIIIASSTNVPLFVYTLI